MLVQVTEKSLFNDIELTFIVDELTFIVDELTFIVDELTLHPAFETERTHLSRTFPVPFPMFPYAGVMGQWLPTRDNQSSWEQ